MQPGRTHSCGQAAPIHAAELEGRKAINLVSSAGEKLVIGHVDFSPKEGGYAFKLAFAREAFREIYMQETNFLCLSQTPILDDEVAGVFSR